MGDWRNQIEKRLGRSGVQPGADQAVVQELAQHLEDRYAELLSSGLEEGTARAAVLAEIENLEGMPAKFPLSKREQSDTGPAAGALASG
jgi:hypothetical protein